jgi:uncharacterized protein (TIGR02448 family)
MDSLSKREYSGEQTHLPVGLPHRATLRRSPTMENDMSRLLLAGALLAFSLPLLAGSFAGSSAGASSAGSSASSGSTSEDDKVVLQARDDAASFVASEGRIRGARLEAALRQLRERDAAARRASDLELAQAILAL